MHPVPKSAVKINQENILSSVARSQQYGPNKLNTTNHDPHHRSLTTKKTIFQSTLNPEITQTPLNSKVSNKIPNTTVIKAKINTIKKQSFLKSVNRDEDSLSNSNIELEYSAPKSANDVFSPLEEYGFEFDPSPFGGQISLSHYSPKNNLEYDYFASNQDSLDNEITIPFSQVFFSEKQDFHLALSSIDAQSLIFEDFSLVQTPANLKPELY
ncbi:hypothetical protein BB560_005675 [Smittium megazygosporum]|uniref:Uncharacterized protein n=1 Tax=Smittium megazygosporum TaxID=133381 RepID=A0A2T9Y1L1_9FUNG|nr:hypothetical protein BB560_006790 [Smittium megazygosporum]PVU98409.1 hypothetical protein BB560_005675 [Smittium megazygosporum]